MSPWLAFILGGMLALTSVLVSVAVIIERLKDDPHASRSASAGFFRALGIVGHYKSVLIVSGTDPIAVSFDDIARAIERGDLLTHPVSHVHHSEPPPSNESCDGNA